MYRSYQSQAQLYYGCSRGGCQYPVAPPGRSMHQYRRAWDVIGPARVLQQAGELWERMGGTWGGRFGDPIHFEA